MVADFDCFRSTSFTLLLVFCKRDSDWRRIVLCFRIIFLPLSYRIYCWHGPSCCHLPLGLSFWWRVLSISHFIKPCSCSLVFRSWLESWPEFAITSLKRLQKWRIKSQSLRRLPQPHRFLWRTNQWYDSGLTHSLVARGIVLPIATERVQSDLEPNQLFVNASSEAKWKLVLCIRR